MPPPLSTNGPPPVLEKKTSPPPLTHSRVDPPSGQRGYAPLMPRQCRPWNKLFMPGGFSQTHQGGLAYKGQEGAGYQTQRAPYPNQYGYQRSGDYRQNPWENNGY